MLSCLLAESRAHSSKLSLDVCSPWSCVATTGFHCSAAGWNFFELFRLGIVVRASVHLVAACPFVNALWTIHQKSAAPSIDLDCCPVTLLLCKQLHRFHWSQLRPSGVRWKFEFTFGHFYLLKAAGPLQEMFGTRPSILGVSQKHFKKPLDFTSMNSYLAILSLNLLHHAALNDSFQPTLDAWQALFMWCRLKRSDPNQVSF